ncbi:MAG: hypothetical protein AAFZ65_15795, partial [Planctomycetota bacterium]
VRAIALDSDGERVAVARKDGHANVFASTGAVELLRVGDRDLVLSTTPRAGTDLTVTVDPLPTTLPILAVGAPIVPVPLPLLGGALEVDPAGAALLLPFAALGPHPTLDLRVPPAASGVPFGLQALHLDPRGSVRLGQTAIRSQIL